MSHTGGWPISSDYGWRWRDGKWRFHHGVDIDCDHGTPLYAPFDGTYHHATHALYGWYWNLVSLDGKHRSRAAHLSKHLAANGQKVRGGDMVALSGGNEGAPGAGNSTGSHTHKESWYIKNGVWRHRDPIDHLGMLFHPRQQEEDDVKLVFKVEGEPGVWITDNGAFRTAVVSGDLLNDLGFKESKVPTVPRNHRWARLPKFVKVVDFSYEDVSAHLGHP